MHHTLLHYALKKAAQERCIVANPASDVDGAAFSALALDSGMRKGELCALRWEDVDFDDSKMSWNRADRPKHSGKLGWGG